MGVIILVATYVYRAFIVVIILQMHLQINCIFLGFALRALYGNRKITNKHNIQMTRYEICYILNLLYSILYVRIKGLTVL